LDHKVGCSINTRGTGGLFNLLPRTVDVFRNYKYLNSHSIVALKAPVLASQTFGSDKSPFSANPCDAPSQYSRLYPGAKFARISSAFSWSSSGKTGSCVQPLMSSGAVALSRYVCSNQSHRPSNTLRFTRPTYLEILWALQQTGVRDYGDFYYAVEREIEGVARCRII
jgi:hypothetical protein